MTSPISAPDNNAASPSCSNLETLHCLPCHLLVDDEGSANVEQFMRITPFEHDTSLETRKRSQRLESSFRGHSMIGEIIANIPKEIQAGLLDLSSDASEIITMDNVVVWRENAKDLDHAVYSIGTCIELAFICKNIFS